MEGVSLLKDFATMLLVAAIVGWIFRKCGLSAVVGYLIAGIIIGPYTPPFALVSDVNRIQAMSDLGLVFLMFFVGLGLSLKRIKQLGGPIVIATTITAFCVFNLCQIFSWAMGWNQIAGLIFAAMFMTSSSAIITKMLAELGITHERFAQNSQGITILEDIVAVVMITIIGARVYADAESQDVGQILFLLLGFTALTIVLGIVIMPRILNRVSQASDADLKSILVAGLVFGAGVASISAGFSVALGAFLFGVVIAETPFNLRIEKRLAGAQDMFSAIFFVSIGMLIDVRAFWDNAGLILAVSAFAIVVRVLSSTTGLLVTGAPVPLALSSAVVLTPIGEFAYIVAQLGVSAKAVPESFYAVAVGTSIVTAILVPLFAKNAERFGNAAAGILPKRWISSVDRYRDALDAIGVRAARNAVWQLTRRRVMMTFLELVMLAGVFGFSRPLHEGLIGFVDKTALASPVWSYIYWGIITVTAGVLVVAVWRSLSTLSMIYAEVLTMRAEQAASLRPMVQFALQTLSAIGLAILIFAYFPLKTTIPWLTLSLLGLTLLLGVAFRGVLMRLHSRFENSLATAVDNSAGSTLARAASDKRARDWSLDVAECLLPDRAACAGKTIQELAIRSKYGCSILEIDRQGYVIANPRPETALFPGDRLLLFGEEAQIQQARDFLSKEGAFTEDGREFDATLLETIEVPENSPFAGHSLAEIGIFARTGVQVVGIERSEDRVLNPTGSEKLPGGSRLLVVGTWNEIRSLESLLEPEQT